MTELREGNPDEAGFLEDRIELIRARAESWINPERTRTLVLLLARRGVVALHDAWGPLTAEPNSPPVQRDSVFSLASVSKPVTATAAMLLVEDGLLSLTRPLVEYISEISGKHTEDILVHHLLTHTSGFHWEDENAFRDERIGALGDVPPCPENQHEFIHLARHATYAADCVRPPGEEMAYSDYHNYGLLAEIVRRVSGKSFWDFTRERIFEPLGMTDSSYRLEDRFEGRLVKASLEPDPGIDIPAGASGLKSTAWDLAILGQTFLSGGTHGSMRLLSRAAVAEMTRNQIPGIGTDFFGTWHAEASWGLGWSVQGNVRWPMFHGALPPLGSFGHGGYGGKLLLIDPAHEIVAVYLSVCLDIDPETGEHHWEADLFQDMAFAAVA